jgi:hypothetical protein
MLFSHHSVVTRPLLALSFTLATLFTATLPNQTAAAQVFKWVDDKGQVHFGEMPPESRTQKAEVYDIRVTPPSSSPVTSTDQTMADKQDDPAEENNGTELKGSVSAEDADKYCQQGRDYKQTLSGSASRRFTQADGSVRPLNDEERAAEQKKADDIIARYCSKS